MPDRTDLDPHLEDYVTSLVRDGRYASRSDVLREGLRLVAEREERLAALDAAIARGLEDAEAGRVTSASDVGVRLVRKYSGAG